MLASESRLFLRPSSSVAIDSFASGDMAPSFAPCTVRSRTRCISVSTEVSAESAVVSQASPLSTLRWYCAVAAWSERTPIALAVAVGSSDGLFSRRRLVAWSYSCA